MRRRELIATAGATATVGLAGCLGFLEDDSGPESAVRGAFQAAIDGDVDRYDELLHSQSPDRPIDEETVGTGANTENITYEVTSTETADADPAVAAIRDRFGGAGTTQEELGTLVAIAENAGDTALVGLTIEATLTLGEQERTESSASTVLTATENGDWTIVTATAESEDQDKDEGDTGN